MAYKNKRSAKRKHRKYRRRSKKGGVISMKTNPSNKEALRDAIRETVEKKPETLQEPATVPATVQQQQTLEDIGKAVTDQAIKDALSSMYPRDGGGTKLRKRKSRQTKKIK